MLSASGRPPFVAVYQSVRLNGGNQMPEKDKLPRWLKPANRVIIALQRLGLAIGTMHLITIPGRKSGKLRATPVSPLIVDGKRYVVGGFQGADWVKNARAAGWGILTRGREEERVALIELPEQERAPILCEFPREVPHGVQFFVKAGIVASPDPESFAAAAPRCPVFRVADAPPVAYSTGTDGAPCSH
jgi:hypothetical protein